MWTMGCLLCRPNQASLLVLDLLIRHVSGLRKFGHIRCRRSEGVHVQGGCCNDEGIRSLFSSSHHQSGSSWLVSFPFYGWVSKSASWCFCVVKQLPAAMAFILRKSNTNCYAFHLFYRCSRCRVRWTSVLLTLISIHSSRGEAQAFLNKFYVGA